MAQPLKIFISSPGDVNDERRRAALVISRLKREFARFFDLSAVLWEYEPMLSSGHFQDIIDPPSTADIVVLILWSRLGTPLPAKTDLREYRSLDGSVPVTGTEWEYEQALDARRRHGVPDLLVYRKFTEGQASFSRIEQLDDIKRQWESLQNFWQRYFEDPDGGFKAAFNRFVTLDEFEAQLELHLRELIRRRLPAQPKRLTGAAAAPEGERIEWWQGSPYRGLQAFDVGQAAVFFGREAAEREITEALVRQAGVGAPFLLVLGASGSGKSSLVRAGLLPDLMAPGVIVGVSTWRYAAVLPTDLGPDPAAGLAAVLLRSDVLPEIAAVGFQPDEVVDQLRGEGKSAATALRLGLARAAAEASVPLPPETRKGQLVLVLDQLEMLFTAPAFTEVARAAFDRLVTTLVQSGLVWVVATLRSDFFHRLTELPGLSALAKGVGQYHLQPPGAPEIEQIVARPAEVAGVGFEVEADTGIGLAAVIREAAARDPASLPLLSFVLDELYRRDVETGGGGQLTYASYRALGGLEGAIARHAEELVGGLPPELAPALPGLLLALVEVDEIKGTMTARTVRHAALADDRQRTLADKLVEARLAVADASGGARTLRVAHEALLSRWPRLASLIEEHRDFLIVRRRLQADAAAWERNGRHADFLLPAGRRLAEAEDALARRRGDLEPETIAYVEASSEAERERVAAAQRLREAALQAELKRSRRVVALVSVLLVIALGAGGFGWWQRNVAETARGEAESSYRLALDQAAGSVELLTSSYEEGAISNKLMRQLMEKAQATVTGLRRETVEVTVARAQLLDVLSLGNVSLGDLAAAQRYAENAVALADALSAQDPANPALRRLWVVAHGRLGEARFWQGDSTGALKELRAAEQAAAKLAAERPDDPQAQRDLIDDYLRLGDVLRSLPDLDGAAAADRAWIAVAEAQAKREPDEPKWRASAALGRLDLGDTLVLQGKWPEASVEYQTAVSLAVQLAEKEPQNLGFLDLQAGSRVRLGDARLEQGNAAAALAEYRIAVTLSTRLSNSDPANFKWREILEASHQRVGEVNLQQRDFAAALAEFGVYLDLARDTLARAPTNGSLLYDVANAQQKIGDVLRAKGDLPGALKQYQASQAITADLVGRNLSTGGWRKIQAMNYHRIGLVLKAQGDRPGALAEFRQCLTITVDKTVWTPRNRWPSDVTEACRDEAKQLAGN